MVLNSGSDTDDYVAQLKVVNQTTFLLSCLLALNIAHMLYLP
jgi:hypothetical protein